MSVIEPYEIEEEGSPTLPVVDAAKPVVVIQYRDRSRLGVLLPPMLILTAALLILAYRVNSPDWRGLTQDEAPLVLPRDSSPPKQDAPPLVLKIETRDTVVPEPAAVPEPANPTPPPPAREVAPVVVKPRADPQPAPAPPVTPTPAPVEKPPADPLPAPTTAPAPPVALPAPGVGAVPGPKKPDPALKAAEETDKAWDDIEREALKRRSEREAVEDLKDRTIRRGIFDAERRKEERQIERQHMDEGERVQFLADLRTALKDQAGNPAQTIREICKRQGAVFPLPLPKVMPTGATAGFPLTRRRERIERARGLGIQEVAILIALAEAEMRNVGSRYGPRNEGEALVRATKTVLAIPLSTNSKPH